MAYKMDWPKLAEVIAKEVNDKFLAPPVAIIQKICEHDNEMYIELLEQCQESHSKNIYTFIAEIRDKYRAFISEIGRKSDKSALSLGDDTTAEEFSKLF